MKHETFYVHVETSEKGYKVTREKFFYPKYDKAILITMKEVIDYWLKKQEQEIFIDIIGNGTYDSFHQSSLLRILTNGYEWKVIFFGNNENDRQIFEFNKLLNSGAIDINNKKEAIKKYNELYLRIADFIDYQD